MDVNSIVWTLLHLLDLSNYSFSRSSSPPEDTTDIPRGLSPQQKILYERKYGVILASKQVPVSVLKEAKQLEANEKKRLEIM